VEVHSLNGLIISKNIYRGSSNDSRSRGSGTTKINPIAITESTPYQKDSDDDELPDDEELELGTDPSRTDTDGDGVSDADELDAR